MNAIQLPFEQTNQFGSFFLNYINGNESLRNFYEAFPNLDSFSTKIKERNTVASRQTLVAALQKQYSAIKTPLLVQTNIEALLSENTFTVTTGHQLNIATGPLYFIYKIISTIRLSEQLREHFPDKEFVPVYWMASEDHDIAEINHFYLFGKKIEWQSEWKGAAGRMPLDGLSEILNEIPQLPEAFKDAYQHSSCLAEATRKLVNSLFGEKGLVILDADDADLKQLFLPVLKDELEHCSSCKLVESTNEQLRQCGFEPQAFVRDINLFYLHDNKRLRLTQVQDKIETVDGVIRKTISEWLIEAEQHPDRFSPNVILRPLYQETILPNLAYLGGPAEMIYWLQLKPVFDHHKTSFPLLVPRNFALYLSPALNQRKEKLGLSFEELFLGYAEIKTKWLERQGGSAFSMEEEIESIRKTFEKIQEKIKAVDATLQPVAGAEEQKVAKQLAELEKRVKKSEERVHEQSLKQLDSLHQKLFPGGHPQERHDNVLNFLINDPSFIDKIYPHLNPLDFRFTLVYED